MNLFFLQCQLRTSRFADFFRAVLTDHASLEASGLRRACQSLFKTAGNGLKPFPADDAPAVTEAWTRPKLLAGLCLALVWAAVFIPRLSLGGLAGHYSLDLKAEDLLLIVLSLLFWARSSGAVASGPVFRIESAFLLFLIFAAVSVVSGLTARTLDKPLVSLLYLIKWFEYFLVFALTARLSQRPQTAQFFLKGFFWLGLAAAAYGYFEHFYPLSSAAYPNYYRLYERPPFHGDANHIGGLFAVWLAFFSCLYLRQPLTPTLSPQGRGRIQHGACSLAPAAFSVPVGRGSIAGQPAVFSLGSTGFPSPFGRGQGEGAVVSWILLAAILFVFFPFIGTFSRKSYFAFAGAYAFLFFVPGISRRRWIFLACLLICAGFVLPTRLAERLSDLGEVMTAVDPFHSSWAGNLDVWGRCFWNFDQFWLGGAGLGARHRLFYESQYVMVLTETGVLGFGALLLLLFVPAVYAARESAKQSLQGLAAAAWLTAWAAFLIHNFSCVSLTVSKAAIPWWFLTGTVFGWLNSRETA